MSVNEAYTGRRFKTPEYKVFAKHATFLLKSQGKLPASFYVLYEFGLSSVLSDWDNPVKPFQDILAAKFKFNDKAVLGGAALKQIVPKGKEFIKFSIYETHDDFINGIIVFFHAGATATNDVRGNNLSV